MKKTLSVGNLSARCGEKKQGFISIYNTKISIPITIINGQNEGKTILITAGIHGCEYPGIQTAIELASEIEASDISGNIIIVHPVNTLAFKKKVSAIVPEDNKNINRMFPGNMDGSISEKIADFITRECQMQSDFYIDLHGGDLYELSTDYVYYPGIAKDEIVKLSKEIASILNVDYMVKSSAKTGAYNFAAIKGVPSILIERGGRGLWSREEVDKYKNDIKIVLNYFNVAKYKDLKVYNEDKPREIVNTIYLNSGYEGCWYPEINPGEKIEKGCILGRVKDFFGNTVETYYAKVNGVVLYMTTALSVEIDEPLVAYGE